MVQDHLFEYSRVCRSELVDFFDSRPKRIRVGTLEI
jgi:hypothetical protein